MSESEFQTLNREYQDLTGKDLFMYATQPNPKGATYYIFTDRNFSNRGNALEYLLLKVAAARQASEGTNTDTTIRQSPGRNRDA